MRVTSTQVRRRWGVILPFAARFSTRTSPCGPAGEAFAKSMLRTIGSQLGRELMRGMMGSLRRQR
jgi:hypothetical protein